MTRTIVLAFVLAVISAVFSKPLDIPENYEGSPVRSPFHHKLWKRFINPSLSLGSFTENGFSKMRTRRSAEEDCEKLQLCKLHAESGHSFFAAYELYFVNKENARLWDHHAHSMADCESRYSGCNGGAATAKRTPPAKAKNFVTYDDDDDY